MTLAAARFVRIWTTLTVTTAMVLTVVALGVGAATAGSASGSSTAPTAPRTSYSFASAPGDYVGGGTSRTFVAPKDDFRVTGDSSRVSMTVLPGGDQLNPFSAEFAAGTGDTLHPGVYPGAERAAFKTGRAPGLDVSGDHRGCNEVYGSFTVNQIAFDDDGNLTLADISFVQHCESPDAPSLTGTFHYHYLPLSYTQSSDAGDYVGGGVTKTYLNSTSTISLVGAATGLSANISGLRDKWQVEVSAPKGTRLTPGQTFATTDFGEGKRGGLWVTGDGHGCNHTKGSVSIKKLTVVDGEITRAWISFVQHCDGSRPALTGELHYFD